MEQFPSVRRYLMGLSGLVLAATRGPLTVVVSVGDCGVRAIAADGQLVGRFERREDAELLAAAVSGLRVLVESTAELLMRVHVAASDGLCSDCGQVYPCRTVGVLAGHLEGAVRQADACERR